MKDNLENINVIIFGATGMVGKGVLIECLESDNVGSILSISRKSCELQHKKLIELIHQDFFDYSSIKEKLKGYDVCFFNLGVSSVGMKEEEYSRITYDITVQAAEILLKLNPNIMFCYVSGAGTDSTEKGRSMWARVKGRTENKLLSMGFKKAYMFRPAYIQPMKGVKSKVYWYQALYNVFGILYPVWKTLFPKYVTSSIKLGKAMINSAIYGYEKNILENKDINVLSKR